MNDRREDQAPKKSGYPEQQPRRKSGSERAPPPDAPRQPQNAPDSRPKPSS